MIPRRWNFSQDLKPWLDDIKDQRYLVPGEITYNFARDFDSYRKQNGGKLQRRTWCFAIVCLLVAAQVILWGLAVL